jgi:hypothetical protein
MGRYELLTGTFREVGTDEKGRQSYKVHRKGAVVESVKELDKVFLNKFRRIDFADEKKDITGGEPTVVFSAPQVVAIEGGSLFDVVDSQTKRRLNSKPLTKEEACSFVLAQAGICIEEEKKEETPPPAPPETPQPASAAGEQQEDFEYVKSKDAQDAPPVSPAVEERKKVKIKKVKKIRKIKKDRSEEEEDED